MIRQTVLGFKMARTEEQLTARGELALMLEYSHGMGETQKKQDKKPEEETPDA